MSDTLPSKTLSIPDGELWSLVRSLISQGTYIQMDATAGKYKHSEEFFARIDEAARERAEEILTKYSAPEPCTVYGGEVHICKNGKYQINRKESCHHCSEITTRAVEIDGDLFNVPEPVAKAIARLRAAPPPSAVLVNAFRAGAFYGCAEEFNPLDLQRDAEAYGSRHSPTK
jgi:regulator of replication initiation timing